MILPFAGGFTALDVAPRQEKHCHYVIDKKVRPFSRSPLTLNPRQMKKGPLLVY
jgi:hypothetical protein